MVRLSSDFGSINSLVYLSIPWCIYQFLGVSINSLVYLSIPWCIYQFLGVSINSLVYLSIPWCIYQFLGVSSGNLENKLGSPGKHKREWGPKFFEKSFTKKSQF